MIPVAEPLQSAVLEIGSHTARESHPRLMRVRLLTIKGLKGNIQYLLIKALDNVCEVM
jgi:hypothetical protein